MLHAKMDRLSDLGRRAFSALLALVLAIGLAPAWQGSALADEADEEAADDGGSFVNAFGDDDEPQFYQDESGTYDAAADEADDAGEAVTVSSTAFSTLSTGSSTGVECVELDDEVISYTNSNTETMQIANERNDGIYYLSDTSLGFYSLDDGSYESVYEFDDCTTAYEEDDLLYVLDDFSCYVYDLDRQRAKSSIDLSAIESQDGVSATTALGVDPSGRIYVATRGTVDGESVYQLWLCSSSGKLLSSVDLDARVYRFDGFDAGSGNFFMESYFNWDYWHYDHPGYAISVGTVDDDDQISLVEASSTVTYSGIATETLDCLEYVCQSTYYDHQKSADVIGGHYLVTTSTTFGRVYVSDAETLDAYLYVARAAIEEEQSSTRYDTNSIGVRCVYNEANDSIVLYENEKTLNEYDIETGEIIGSYETAHYVFNLITLGDDVIAIEKEDGQFYMEVINWAAPTDFQIAAESDTMQVGESQQLSIDSEADYETAYSWSSSDDGIVSVTSDGLASAWSEGTAIISCTSPDGSCSANIAITVSGSTVEASSLVSERLEGAVSDNESDNSYTVYGSVVNSYLYENDDGGLTRVEYLDDAVLVEDYSADHELQSSQTIDMELSLFGGFYAGEDCNWLVFGEQNEDDSDENEVLRVVKYSKSWKRLGACSIEGANTSIPFDAGSLRMTETGGQLYVYTCHEMYSGHQSNMTFVIDEDSLSVTDSYYETMNISYGYVSHSFNQFIQTDGDNIYRVDHGDYAPRGVSLTVCPVENGITDLYGYGSVFSIGGSGNSNLTGLSVGGFELSGDNCLVVGNSVDQDDDDYDASGQRNIFLSVTDKHYFDSEAIWITDYDEDDGVTPRTPQFVKLSDDRFLIMWEEEDEESEEVVTRAVTVNGEGTVTSSIASLPVRLSDCQPILTSEGAVTWYVTDGEDLVLYTLNPYDMPFYFNDVPAGDSGLWYYDAVYGMSDLGYITGYTTGSQAGNFGVGDQMTRAQFVTILWRIACPEDYAAYEGVAESTSGLSDVSDDRYYTAAVNWAVEEGVVTGYDNGKFGVNDPMTFQDMCLIIARYAGADDGSYDALTYAQGSEVLAGFADGSSVSRYAEPGVVWCVQEDLVSGNDDGVSNPTLSPKEKVARERVAVVLYRALEEGVL